MARYFIGATMHFIGCLWARRRALQPGGWCCKYKQIRRPGTGAVTLRESGCDFKPNVRGTMNGPSPHNGESPNDHCELLERPNMPWVTITHLVARLRCYRQPAAPSIFSKLMCGARASNCSCKNPKRGVSTFTGAGTMNPVHIVLQVR